MSSFRCGCERGEVVSGGRRSSSWWRQFRARRWLHPAPRPCASGWCASSARSNWWCGCTLARRRAAVRGTRVLPRGRRVNGSLRRSCRPASVCVFVPCSLWFSLLPCFWVWLLLTVCGPSRRRPFRVEQSRREPGCRPVGCVETVRPLRGHARSRAGVVARLRVLDRQRRRADRRPSGEAIGAERRRVENSRRRPSAAASTQVSYGSGAARLAAVLERDALGRRLLFITCTFRLLAPSVRPPRVGRRCRRTTVPAACSDSGTRSRPHPWGDWTVPKSNSLMTARPSGNPCVPGRPTVTRFGRRGALAMALPSRPDVSLFLELLIPGRGAGHWDSIWSRPGAWRGEGHATPMCGGAYSVKPGCCCWAPALDPGVWYRVILTELVRRVALGAILLWRCWVRVWRFRPVPERHPTPVR